MVLLCQFPRSFTSPQLSPSAVIPAWNSEPFSFLCSNPPQNKWFCTSICSLSIMHLQYELFLLIPLQYHLLLGSSLMWKGLWKALTMSLNTVHFPFMLQFVWLSACYRVDPLTTHDSARMPRPGPRGSWVICLPSSASQMHPVSSLAKNTNPLPLSPN